jgi:hypothetical protein
VNEHGPFQRRLVSAIEQACDDEHAAMTASSYRAIDFDITTTFDP